MRFTTTSLKYDTARAHFETPEPKARARPSLPRRRRNEARQRSSWSPVGRREHRGPAPHSLEQGSLSEGHPSAMAASQGGASCLPAFSSVLSLVKIKSLFLFGFFFFFWKGLNLWTCLTCPVSVTTFCPVHYKAAIDLRCPSNTWFLSKEKKYTARFLFRCFYSWTQIKAVNRSGHWRL